MDETFVAFGMLMIMLRYEHLHCCILNNRNLQKENIDNIRFIVWTEHLSHPNVDKYAQPTDESYVHLNSILNRFDWREI